MDDNDRARARWGQEPDVGRSRLLAAARACLGLAAWVILMGGICSVWRLVASLF